MNKSYGYIALGMCAVVLAGFTLIQQAALTKQLEEKQELTTTLAKVRNSLVEEKLISVRFQEDNEMLLDSIQTLHVWIADLEHQIQEQDEIIAELEGKLSRRLKKFKELEDRIALLEEDGQKNQKEIARLEAEKTALLEKMQHITDQKEAVEEERKVLKDEKLENEVTQRKLDRIAGIQNNTWINYAEVELRKKPHRGDLSKVREGSDKWKYTWVKFTMVNDQTELLTEQNFVLKIVNSATGEILQYIEANPQYPGSDAGSTGIGFTFTNNPVELLHINGEEKMGQNFELRIYYVEDGKEYLLQNSIKPILNNGKPFSL